MNKWSMWDNMRVCDNSRVSDPMLNPDPIPKSVNFLDYPNFGVLFDIEIWSHLLELVQLSIGYKFVNIELAKFVEIKKFLMVTKGVENWATYPIFTLLIILHIRTI